MFIRFATKSRIALLLGLVFLAAACGSSAAKTAVPTNSTHSDPTAVSSTANNEFGTILTDGNGRTLYFFDNDKPIKPQSSCTDQCVKAWPIVNASNGSAVGAGVDAAKLGHIVRSDGQEQLTYNNWPLYTFSGDTAAGETNGQGIGGIWHVVGVDGKPITAAMVQPASPAGAGYQHGSGTGGVLQRRARSLYFSPRKHQKCRADNGPASRSTRKRAQCCSRNAERRDRSAKHGSD